MSAPKPLTPDDQSPASPASCLRPFRAGSDAYSDPHCHPHDDPIAYADPDAHTDPVTNADGHSDPSAEADDDLA